MYCVEHSVGYVTQSTVSIIQRLYIHHLPYTAAKQRHCSNLSKRNNQLHNRTKIGGFLGWFKIGDEVGVRQDRSISMIPLMVLYPYQIYQG